MKKQIILLSIAIGSVISANAQSPAFTDAALQQVRSRQILSFAVPREVNVRYYRVEAGADSLHMGIIATIPAKGNSVMPVSYHYDATADKYAYFRVSRIGMNSDVQSSAVIFTHSCQPESAVVPCAIVAKK